MLSSLVRNSILTLCLLTGLLHPAQSMAQLLTGIEQEYYVNGPTDRGSRHQNSTLLLAFVRKHFGRQGTIAFQPWTKWSNFQDLTYAEMLDGQGRVWQVTPEKLAYADSYDGYELIPPPLDFQKEGRQFQALLRDIRLNGHFKKGPRSSSHFSYDISHLFEGEDISRVINLILFIEKHMIEIMNAVGSLRTGHTFSQSTIPLGLNQPDLLAQLAQLKTPTWEAGRSVFNQFMVREVDLFGIGSNVWKNRAVNYGKVFRLGPFSTYPIPLLEFRLPDLANESEALVLDALFQKIIEVGSRTPTHRFENPFKGHEEFNARRLDGSFHDEVDRRIQSLSPEDYRYFIEGVLGLSLSDFPQKYKAPSSSVEPSGRGCSRATKHNSG